jgi:hypothetical protein
MSDEDPVEARRQLAERLRLWKEATSTNALFVAYRGVLRVASWNELQNAHTRDMEAAVDDWLRGIPPPSADKDRLRDDLSRLISVAVTVERRNTREFLDYLASVINDAAATLGDKDKVAVHGSGERFEIIRHVEPAVHPELCEPKDPAG